jgi:glucose-6-phosphate 1-dehydrogenase
MKSDWVTPMADTLNLEPAGPCTLVIFGASGDLARRLLFPSLYNLARDGLLPEQFAVVGFARLPGGDDQFREQLRTSLRAGEAADPATIEWLASRAYYLQSDFTEQSGYVRLAAKLSELDRVHGTGRNCLFYLATAPEYFLEIAQRLGRAGLLDEAGGRWRRLVVEKPFGRDLDSARRLNRELTQAAREEQIYRIDHYLGKETVQNILVLRFANGIFEPVWNRRYIEHVQITVAETVGVELRGNYYDHTGALRDMVPNHLLQLLTLTAMEPPSSFSPAALHNEQGKVLESIPPLGKSDCGLRTVRAQYLGYRDEPRVAPDSATETYVAMTLAVDNWRWAGVPFYLRTGKRLATRRTEVVIQFRKAPLTLFRNAAVALPSANRLWIRIQPEENISLEFDAKQPGPTVTVRPVQMRFCYRDYFGLQSRTGYETLLYDAMIGDASLFKRADVIEAGWAVVEPVLEAWEHPLAPLGFYPAGSEGPAEAVDLLRRDGYEWVSLT